MPMKQFFNPSNKPAPSIRTGLNSIITNFFKGTHIKTFSLSIGHLISYYNCLKFCIGTRLLSDIKPWIF